MLEARTERPVGVEQFNQDTNKFVIDDDDIESDSATESNLTLKSRLFLHKEMIDCEKYWKHSFSWERITQKIYIPSKTQGMISS